MLIEKDNQIVMYNDEIALTMYEGPILDTSKAKEKRIKMGYTLIGERNYTFAGAKINQQNYNSEGINTCVYMLEKNNKTYIITLNVDEDYSIPEYDENPVTEIICTLK